MGCLFFAGFNFVGGCAITVGLILSAGNTPHPTLGLALLTGGTLMAAGVGLPADRASGEAARQW